jgi:hypothetical protein
MYGESLISDQADIAGAINSHRLCSTENDANADAGGMTPRQFQGTCVQTAPFEADDYKYPDQSRLDLHNQHPVYLRLSNTTAAVSVMSPCGAE